MSLVHETIVITVRDLFVCPRYSLKSLNFKNLNHQTIASTPDPKVLGLKLNYMFGQALYPNLIPRLLMTFGSYKIKYSDNHRVSKTVSLPM